MKRTIYRVDAFTSQPYSGNPAGVMPNADGLSDYQMQDIAKEMNLSETAFVFLGGVYYDFEVRFFTPTEEVDLCGHATIATFSLLKSLNIIKADVKKITQKTKAGLLEVSFLENNLVIMQQSDPVNIKTEVASKELSEIMGIDLNDIGFEDFMKSPEIWSTGLKDILLPLKSLLILKDMKPSMEKLSDYSKKLGVIGVHAFAVDINKQIWCRNFAPAFGIEEESATGTSNGALGACLYTKGYQRDGELNLKINQGDWMESPSRIFVKVNGKNNPKVWVGGEAIKVFEREIAIEKLEK